MTDQPMALPSLDGAAVRVNYAVVPNQGEDSIAFATDTRGGFLCVADGCGGLGSRRYEEMADQTGAYLAARIATEVVKRWAPKGFPLPRTGAEGSALCGALGTALGEELRRFEAGHQNRGSIRIVGRMQRALPTTLCAALLASGQKELDCLFFWAGDSRGYLLDGAGLHQLTADHSSGGPDAMESLYKDAPLTNLLCAGEPCLLSARRVRWKKPCVAVLATDGAFSYLPTPMEFEWLLLSTLHAATALAGWQKKLRNEMEKITSDDGTLLMALYGYESFEALKLAMEPRRLALQREYITPVRRRKQDVGYAQQKWREYREGYDRTEGTANGEPDWRI